MQTEAFQRIEREDEKKGKNEIKWKTTGCYSKYFFTTDNLLRNKKVKAQART